MDSDLSTKFEYGKNNSSFVSGSITASGVTSGSVGSTYASDPKSTQTIPIDQRPLNVDHSPILIRKKPDERIEHIQNVSVKFLKPPPPEMPGDLTIIQDADTRAPSPPPLVMRNNLPSEPIEPQPLIIREKPPKAPQTIPDKIVTIPGKILQKPRKIIIEHVFREVRYENVPPQFTREQIKKYIKDKLRRQKSSGEQKSIEFESKENGSSSMLTNVSALLNDDSKNSTPIVSHASASFRSRSSSRENSQFISSNDSVVLSNLTNRPNASIQFSTNNSVDLSNTKNKSIASIQYASNNSASNISNIIENNNYINNYNNNNNNNVSFSGETNLNSRQEINSNASIQIPQQSHINTSMSLHEPRPAPIPYYPGYEPPQSHFFGLSNFSRQNVFYATGPIRQIRSVSRAPPIIHYENNYTSLSADFIPNREAMTEIDIYNRMNVNQNNFRRSSSLMRPQHEDADTGLRLLGFNL